MAGNNTGGDTEKDKHLKLACVVKGVHAKLRKDYRQSGDYKQVWMAHCQDSSVLLEYADAMHRLATEIWTKHPETRIDWCRNVCIEYFLSGGLKKVFEKEQRRKIHFEHTAKADENKILETCQHQRSKSDELARDKTSVHDSTGIPNINTLSASASHIQDHMKLTELMSQKTENCQSILETDVDSLSVLGSVVLDKSTSLEQEVHCASKSTDPLSCNIRTNTFSQMPSPCHNQKDCEHASFLTSESELIFGLPEGLEPNIQTTHGQRIQTKFNAITLPFEGGIRLLDVGSCYNAFQNFDEFQAIGIDICPAVEGVHHCDFLHLNVLEPLQLAADSIGAFLHNLRSPIESLPAETFHVLVFSLLLEYFPSRYQRWICCQKAHELLAVNGILIIITPDSHHQNRNAPMIKSWKTAIESIGFVRWRYVKLEHLHCMVFRKIIMKEMASLIGDTKPDMLYIPQDSNANDDVLNPFLFDNVPQTHEDMLWLKSNFEELPDIDDNS